MPFLTPQYVGHKEGRKYLLSLDITWEDDYMKKGLEMSQQYSKDETSQRRYIQGWKQAFEENTNSIGKEEL